MSSPTTTDSEQLVFPLTEIQAYFLDQVRQVVNSLNIGYEQHFKELEDKIRSALDLSHHNTTRIEELETNLSKNLMRVLDAHRSEVIAKTGQLITTFLEERLVTLENQLNVLRSDLATLNSSSSHTFYKKTLNEQAEYLTSLNGNLAGIFKEIRELRERVTALESRQKSSFFSKLWT
jgi:exonuclease VII large subunit